MNERIVLIGAGSASFGLGTVGDILNSQVLQGSTIILHDTNAQALARVERIVREHVSEHRLPYDIAATTSRRDALRGATFCVISIEVGNRFELWDQDWRIPQQYGIRQVYGENGGPGGLFHALRIIPPILEICADVMELCPEAYVFNFSNPMSRICLAVKRKFPAIRLTGLCHEASSLPQHLPGMLNTPFANLAVKAGGLNHFSVVLEARYKDTGADAYPDIRARARAYFEDVPTFTQIMRCALTGEELDPAAMRRWEERWLVLEILDRFGYLPVTTDSHFGEYIQWAHEVVDHEGIIEFYRWYRRWCVEREPESRIGGSGERVVPIIEAILTDAHEEELAVNVMNDGLIDNLPRDLVVEVPAVVDKGGVHGVRLGALPKGIAGLLANQVAVHDLTAEAALTGSRQAALQALLVDPVVHSVTAAERTLDTILRLQEQYLGYLK